MNIELKSKFLSLASQLSPENLCCDGELRGRALQAKARKLHAEWAALEKEAGRSVSEDETWAWVEEVRLHEARARQARMDALPQHRLLVCNNPGTWSRKATEHQMSSGLSAYTIRNESMRDPIKFNGQTFRASEDPKFHVNSEFAHVLFRNERVGSYDTLDEAVKAAEAFLQTITFDLFKEKTAYRDENIQRELRRLPHYF